MNANRVGHPPAVGRGDRQRPAGARNWPPAVRLRGSANRAPWLRVAPVRSRSARDGLRRAVGWAVSIVEGHASPSCEQPATHRVHRHSPLARCRRGGDKRPGRNGGPCGEINVVRQFESDAGPQGEACQRVRSLRVSGPGISRAIETVHLVLWEDSPHLGVGSC